LKKFVTFLPVLNRYCSFFALIGGLQLNQVEKRQFE